jgi:hypothetical protein
MTDRRPLPTASPAHRSPPAPTPNPQRPNDNSIHGPGTMVNKKQQAHSQQITQKVMRKVKGTKVQFIHECAASPDRMLVFFFCFSQTEVEIIEHHMFKRTQLFLYILHGPLPFVSSHPTHGHPFLSNFKHWMWNFKKSWFSHYHKVTPNGHLVCETFADARRETSDR